MGLSSCIYCNSQNVIPVLYGFPYRYDFPDEWAYGGTALEQSSPSHYCADCNESWLESGAELAFFPFPTDCHFCGEPLSVKDQFVCQTESETWYDSQHAPFMLESGTFSADPFAVCTECRNEIQINNEGLQEDAQHDTRMRKISHRAIMVFLVYICLIVVYSIFFGESSTH